MYFFIIIFLTSCTVNIKGFFMSIEVLLMRACPVGVNNWNARYLIVELWNRWCLDVNHSVEANLITLELLGLRG